MSTVRELFQSSVKNFPDKTALVEDNKRVSYKELGSMVDSFSSFLTSKGINKGDTVAVLLPNSIEFVTAFFSIASLGAVSVPVNTAFKKEEISYYVNHSSAKLVLTEVKLKPLAEDAVSDSNTLVAVVKGEYAEWNITKADSNPLEVSIEPDDEAIYLYSTGSTGKPKRVSRTHLNLVALADNHTETVGWTEEDKILFAVPISHTYGFGNFISSIKIGASIVVLGDFNRNRVLDLLEEESITVFPAVPVMLDVLAKTYIAEPKDLSSLKLVISAGSPLPERIFHSFYGKYGIYPRQLYGSSETGVISINLSDDIENTFNSVGRHVKNVEVRIIDEDGKEAGVDEVGEIAVKSPSMTTGYYGLLAETKKVFRGGYYFTGDLGRIDPDGFIYIVGRKKFFINISGNKVDPLEVENFLLTHPKIKEAAVLGINDSDGNERVKAVLVADKGLEKKEILEFCKDEIAEFKIPRIIEFRDELPRSPTGKVLREELK
jgi:long-chain acyl-CoA synthetase